MAIFFQALAKVGGATSQKIRCAFLCALLLQQYFGSPVHAARKGEGEFEALDASSQVAGGPPSRKSQVTRCALKWVSSTWPDAHKIIVKFENLDSDIRSIVLAGYPTHFLVCTEFKSYALRVMDKNGSLVGYTKFEPLREFIGHAKFGPEALGLHVCVYEAEAEAESKCLESIREEPTGGATLEGELVKKVSL
eukprot:TRINITY_DN7287_c0_g2_i1.p1 TRINITY_DN7287_c0_g2~~TRINITY_DN7287_c0_g2_i1.p1  ORF type:complete len:220 (-),score=26.80 TRINITY_DN7287_c0_g2_i1:304-882(-)